MSMSMVLRRGGRLIGRGSYKWFWISYNMTMAWVWKCIINMFIFGLPLKRRGGWLQCLKQSFQSYDTVSSLQLTRPRDNLKGVLPRRLMTLPRRLNWRRCLWQTHQTKVGHERNLVCGCQYPMTWLWHAIEYTNVMSMCILLIWLRE